jgi:hypothetical protein
MKQTFAARVNQFLGDLRHPNHSDLIKILAGKTSISSTGFPYISENSFQQFMQSVPHLFRDGNSLLSWLKKVEDRCSDKREFSEFEIESLQRAVRVLRNIVHSASICAPPDLWILRHVLSVHAQLGLIELYRSHMRFTVETLKNKLPLDSRHILWDVSLLLCRGYLEGRGTSLRLSEAPHAEDVMRNIIPIEGRYLTDMVEPMFRILKNGPSIAKEKQHVNDFLSFAARPVKQNGWYASYFQLEVGYRLVPLLLAIHLMKISAHATEGTDVVELLPGITEQMKALLRQAGMLDEKSRFTALAIRVLQRGPGPFGIIHAYVPYMKVLQEKLSGQGAKTWVNRGKNIAASQDANRKTFQMANDSLDRFCKDLQFQHRIYIEHALGQGEVVRQRFQQDGEENIQYFGADLEDAAVDRAVEFQKQRSLPRNMMFIHRADIANPQIVIDAIRNAGFSTNEAVMFVGNGFHEIRGQTNEKIVDVFRGYCDAGILILFTEESALGDQDLLRTGWNTYHAGFRYVHRIVRPGAQTGTWNRSVWQA